MEKENLSKKGKRTRLIPLTAVMVVISILIGLQLSYLSIGAHYHHERYDGKKDGQIILSML